MRLRDATGATVARSPQGHERFSMGQHGFGFIRAEATFASLPTEIRGVTLELRGEWGDWDAPLDLVLVSEAPVSVAVPIRAEQERDGITVRVFAMATTDAWSVVDIVVTATPPARAVSDARAWADCQHGYGFTLDDEHGHRFDEVWASELPPPYARDGGRTIAAFPRLPPDSGELMLSVPRVIEQSVGSLEIELPVPVTRAASLGPHPVRIRWAGLVDDARTAPGEQPEKGSSCRWPPRRGAGVAR
jgi:hypothetical protein